MTRTNATRAAQGSPARQQDSAIQAIRGVAVILLVSFHVIGSSTRGLRVSDDSLWHLSSMALEDIRMPLFTLISGYVYAMAPVGRWNDYPRLVKGKTRRVLLPLIVVGTIMYVVGRVVPGDNFDARDLPLWRIYFFSFEHFWFLQAIFLIFVIVGVLDGMDALASHWRWFAITAAAATASIVVSVPTALDVFSVSGALALLPFFLLGYGLRRHALLDLRGAPAAVAVAVFLALYAIRLSMLFGDYHPAKYAEKSLAIIVGALGIILIYSARNVINTRLLAWIGGFSFGIYLLHVFATAATRMLLECVGIHQTWELFTMGLFMGIAAPIAVQLAFRNVDLVRTCVFGERGFDGIAFVRQVGGGFRHTRPQPQAGETRALRHGSGNCVPIGPQKRRWVRSNLTLRH
jgi:acyltransferase